MALVNHARPISEVLKDQRVSPRVQGLLSEIAHVKKFGEAMGLKPTSNYQDYVQLDRKAAVWVVSACESLKFKSKEWVFPVVGSFPYLGWFDRKNASKFADELKKEGWDVDLRGAGAYSTLGWFRDSVLSTMLSDGDEALGDLTNVVIHESVHATLYFKGQAYFNESLASFVADGLTQKYLDQTGPDKKAYLAYLEGEKRHQEFEVRFHQAYHELDVLYQSKRTDSEKLKEKARILADLQSQVQFKRDINNATIIQFKTYNSGASDFQQLLLKCEGSWPRFIQSVQRLKSESFSKSQQEELGILLAPLIQSVLDRH